MEGHINKYVGADNVQDRGAAVDNGGTGAASNGATGVVLQARASWPLSKWLFSGNEGQSPKSPMQMQIQKQVGFVSYGCTYKFCMMQEAPRL